MKQQSFSFAQEIQSKLSSEVDKLIKEKALAHADWTERMIKDFIVQLVNSGDIYRLVTADAKREEIIYTPYYEVTRLRQQQTRIKEILSRYKHLMTATDVAELNSIFYYGL